MKKPKGRLFLVQWDGPAAVDRAEALRGARWDVEVEYEDGERAYKRMAAVPPDAAVFDLSVKPSHSRATAKAARDLRLVAEVPFLFVDGEADARDRVKEEIAGAMFVSSTGLLEALDALGIPEQMNQVIGGARDAELHD